MDGGGKQPPEGVPLGLEPASRSSGFFFDRASTNVSRFADFGAFFLLFLSAVPRFLPCPAPGAFLDTSFPMCRESTALAILTISLHCVRAAAANPAESLRFE